MSKTHRNKLQKKKIEFIINSREYEDSLKEVCNDIINGSTSADNEATVVSIFEL